MTEHDDSKTPQTHFGYQQVEEGQKAGLVQGVFTSVANRYDLMNDLMSGGVHRIWKGAMVDWLAPRPGMKMLDVAGGTGDIAFRILDRLEKKAGLGGTELTILDLTEDMLRRDGAGRGAHLLWRIALGEWRRHGFAIRRQPIRRLYNRIRNSERHARRRRTCGGLSRSETGRALFMSGIQRGDYPRI